MKHGYRLTLGLICLYAFIGVQLIRADEGDEEMLNEMCSPLVSDDGTSAPIVYATPEDEPKWNPLTLIFGRNYQSLYSKIDDYLFSKTHKDTVGENMEYARQWLASLKSGENKCMFRGTMIESLEQLLSLSKLEDDKFKCTEESYNILLKNDLATRGAGHRRPSKIKEFRRVDRIVYTYSLDHAIYCYAKYPSISIQKLSEIDAEDLHRVEKFTNDIIYKYFKDEHRSSSLKDQFFDITTMFRLVNSYKSISSKDSAKVTLDVLRFLASDDVDRNYLYKNSIEKGGKYGVIEEEFENLYTKYIVEPCQFYAAKMGHSVFIPAAYDNRMLELEDRYKIDGPNMSDFFVSWARYVICDKVSNKDRNDLLKQVIREANQEESVGF